MLLLGCCGNGSMGRISCGRDCGCDNDRGCGGRRRRDCGCGERRERDCGCDSGRDCGCGGNDCGRAAREAAREAVRDAREAVRDAREAVRDAREQSCCDNGGMVPPPWQDYPPMPRRDSGCDCD